MQSTLDKKVITCKSWDIHGKKPSSTTGFWCWISSGQRAVNIGWSAVGMASKPKGEPWIITQGKFINLTLSIHGVPPNCWFAYKHDHFAMVGMGPIIDSRRGKKSPHCMNHHEPTKWQELSIGQPGWDDGAVDLHFLAGQKDHSSHYWFDQVEIASSMEVPCGGYLQLPIDCGHSFA